MQSETAAGSPVDDPVHLLRRRLVEQQALIDRVLSTNLAEQVAALAEQVTASLLNGGTLLLFGNGGSSADASHIAAELVGRLSVDRRALPALALGDQHAALTSVANDDGYGAVFVRGIQAFGRPGDVAIGLTTSGQSTNVLRGLQVARERGLITAAFTGERDSALRADTVVRIPSSDTQRIQEVTMHLCHTLCELVERASTSMPTA